MVPAAASSRQKGPAAQFAVECDAVECDAAEATGDDLIECDPAAADGPLAREGDALAPRLPRLLPLSPLEGDEVDDEDLLGAPALDAAMPAVVAGRAGTSRGAGAGAGPGDHPAAADDEGGGSEPGEEPPPGEGRASAPEAGEVDPSAAEGVDSAEPITDPARLVRAVFALLLTSRDGLSPLRLAQVCDTTQEAVRAALDALRTNLAAQDLPLELTQSGESFKLWTSPEVFPYLEKLRGIRKNERLSLAALETLAVIAYRQPVFRAEIEAVRGVKAGPMLRTLLDCKLIKVVGRADVPGRPLQYGTTQQFLERFGLASLADLPSVKEFKGLSG